MIVRGAGALLGAAAGGVLARRMVHEFEATGFLSARTAALLGVAYVGHASWGMHGLLRRSGRVPVPGRTAVALGIPVAGAGTVLLLAASSRFQSMRQLWGLESDGLVTGGPYRASRNPQYTGYGPGSASRSGSSPVSSAASTCAGRGGDPAGSACLGNPRAGRRGTWKRFGPCDGLVSTLSVHPGWWGAQVSVSSSP